MPGFVRDLAVATPWEASLERSRARRARGRTAAKPRRVSELRAFDPFGLGALLAREHAPARRDLADGEPWELSLGRSRARRRAAELRFVPNGSRAKRISLGALAAISAGPAASLAASGQASAAELPTSTEHSITISSESEGRQVELVQRALGIAVDGIYGPETEAAVRSFQAAHALAVDGIVGPETSAALRDGARAVASSTAGSRTDAVMYSQSGEGSYNAVSRLQAALHVTPDGIFGPETEAAVRRLQARNGLTVDGIVGPATWSAIGVSGEETITPSSAVVSEAKAVHATTTVADAQAPASTAATSDETSSGNEVSRLQAALHLEADGDFGPETEAAVRRLQARHGLAVDGVVGPSTWAVLGVSDAPTLKPPASALVGDESTASHTIDVSDTSDTSDASSSTGESAGVIARVIAAAGEIATRPYVYGGGHGSFESTGYDCSGSVSYALHGGGLLSAPEDSSELEGYGEAGPGRYITIYANAEHAFMVIDGKRFDTIAQQETGTRWADSVGDTSGYVVRHPDGL
jgi:peptidoglycan hydrolase-like protein with peptidoglycan-binding domain